MISSSNIALSGLKVYLHRYQNAEVMVELLTRTIRLTI